MIGTNTFMYGSNCNAMGRTIEELKLCNTLSSDNKNEFQNSIKRFDSTVFEYNLFKNSNITHDATMNNKTEAPKKYTPDTDNIKKQDPNFLIGFVKLISMRKVALYFHVNPILEQIYENAQLGFFYTKFIVPISSFPYLNKICVELKLRGFAVNVDKNAMALEISWDL